VVRGRGRLKHVSSHRQRADKAMGAKGHAVVPLLLSRLHDLKLLATIHCHAPSHAVHTGQGAGRSVRPAALTHLLLSRT
jgi:hypothetical protein